ncbi:MAG TPA: site-specific integrase [Actinomycetota bacterium]|nr:site-specific integrase [Actinomycetota bacterium]
MPREFEGPRVKKTWIESRQKWRVLTVYPDQEEAAKHFDAEREADDYVENRLAHLARLDEVTWGRAIALHKKDRIAENLRTSTVNETDRRLRDYFGPVLNATCASMTPRRFRELYDGRWDGDRPLFHGLRNRPTLKLRKGETREEPKEGWVCTLACKCPGEGPPLKPDSHRNYLLEVHTFIRKTCLPRGFIAYDPFDKTKELEPLKGRGKRNKGGLGENILTRKELRAIYRQCLVLGPGGDEGAVAVLFAFYFAMRIKEIVTRQGRHIDEETWVVEVDKRAGKTKSAGRGLVIPKRLRPIMRKMIRGAEDFIFVGRGGESHKRPQWVNRSLKRICTLAGVDPTRAKAHALRGAHNDLAEQDGQTAAAIERQLGHKPGGRSREDSYQSEMGRTAARQRKADAVFKVLEGGRRSSGKGGR